MKGKIKFLKPEKGWGFITGEDGKDVFFHITDLVNKEDKLAKDDAVEYELGEGRKGKKAVRIKKIGGGDEDKDTEGK